MPKTREQKKLILDELNKKIENSKSIVFATFSKLGVKQSEELRHSLKKEGSEYFVAKKTLLALALDHAKIDVPLVKACRQNLSVIFGYNDELAPAKIIEKFKKDNPDTIDIYGGVLENLFISREQAIDLAKIPSRNELYAKLVGTINAPISGLVRTLAGNISNLVSVLANIKESKSN